MTGRELAEVAALLSRAERVLFITGAGISADSGLPTYRGVGGLYVDRDTEDGFPVEVALSGPMFKRDPAVTWKYIWQVGEVCAKASPNLAHQFIADLETRRADVWVLTQNVDGLHRAAGSKNLVEVHGHAFDLYCVSCGRRFEARALIQGFQAPTFDMVFSIGTTAVFPYIEHFIAGANRAGVPRVEVNPADTGLSGMCSHRLRLSAVDAVRGLRQAAA